MAGVTSKCRPVTVTCMTTLLVGPRRAAGCPWGRCERESKTAGARISPAVDLGCGSRCEGTIGTTECRVRDARAASLLAALVLLSEPRRQDLELLPILRHCSSGDDQPVLLQDVGDLLVRQGPPRVFLADDIQDARLGSLGRDLVPVLGIEARGEEVLELEHP